MCFHTWAKDYVKYDGHNVERIHIFLSGSRGTTDVSHLVKVLYNAISKALLCQCEDPEKSRVLLLEPTGMSAANIGGNTIHSDLGIKPGIKLLGLKDKSKVTLRNRLSEVKLLIIDELFMVSSELSTDINSSLGEIFMMIPEKAFAVLSVTTVTELLQLPPFREKLISSQFSDKDSMKHLLGLQLWHLSKNPELIEVVR